MNVVVLQGRLVREPQERTLQSGERLVTYEVATGDGAGTSRAVPVAWLSPGRREPAVDVDDEVTVVGAVARRFFRSGATTISRTEVVASVVVPSRRRAAARRAVADAVAGLGALNSPE
jgi:hypothetical protein